LKRYRRLIAGAVIALAMAALPLGALTVPAGASTQPATARSITLTAAQRQYLRSLYAAFRHIPLTDVGKVAADQAEAARAGGDEWAAVSFLPAKGAPAAVVDQFQDGADTAIFTRPATGRWTTVGLAGEPFACGLKIASSVRRLWHVTNCPATPAVPPSRSSHPISPASDTQQLADIAEDEVGVSDNPAETGFGGLDCNPYTAFMNPSAPTSDPTQTCGTDPTFGIQDHSELWCADFTKWVWEQAGVTSDLGTLTAGADTFYAWAQAQGESLPVDPTDPQVGDAIVFYPYAVTPSGTSGADHVGIVTAVNADGSIDMANGDFLGKTNISVQGNNDISDLQTWANGNWENGISPHNGPEQWVFVTPQLPTADRVPAVATDSFGNIYSFWRSTSGNLEEANYSASSGTWSGPNDLGYGQLGSEPTVATGPQSSGGYAYQYVFWRGANGDLWEAFWNGSWQGPKDLGYGPLGSAPTVGVDSSGNEYVFWESANAVPADRGLEEAEWNGSSWGSAHAISGMGPLGSSPTVAVAADGDQYVFWEGTNGDLWEAFWNGSSWNGPTDRGDGTLGSPPAAGVDGSGNEYVFWESGSGNLEETQWNGSSWGSAHAISGMGPLGSAPAVAVASGGDQYVFWEGTGPNYDLWEAAWGGSSWSGPSDDGFGPLS
jgi:hypothetical protein